MSATVPKNRSHFDRTFCLVIGWMEVAYEGKDVWIWEADEDTGRLVLVGEPLDCQKFQSEAGQIIAATPDPGEDWRNYG